MTDNLVLRTINSRRSVRGYTDEPVANEQIEALIEAALAAPSGLNKQPWHIVVVKNRALLEEMEQDIVDYYVKTDQPAYVERLKSRGNKSFYNAQAAIFIAINDYAYAVLGAGIVAENITLAATSMGLGSIIIGFPDTPIFKSERAGYWEKKLSFPEGFHFGISVAVGHAAEQNGKQHEHDHSKVTVIE